MGINKLLNSFIESIFPGKYRLQRPIAPVPKRIKDAFSSCVYPKKRRITLSSYCVILVFVCVNDVFLSKVLDSSHGLKYYYQTRHFVCPRFCICVCPGLRLYYPTIFLGTSNMSISSSFCWKGGGKKRRITLSSCCVIRVFVCV